MKKSTIILLTVIGGLTLLGGGGVAVYTMTRGLRNNNPGNIRDDGTDWEGLATPRNDGTFLRFIDPTYGIRAMARILSNYVVVDGLAPTVTALISRYAPPTENDTAAYIQAVSSRMGVDPNAPLDIAGDLPVLIAAMIPQENAGFQPYADATIQQGVALAA
jgi:hypothetical protein